MRTSSDESSSRSARPTIEDVALRAGVSIKTVSRVINREPGVRESTRHKVERSIASLNYRPNLSARNLASHHTNLIVLVYDDPSAYETPSSGYIIRMQQGVLRACATAGYDLLIHPCNYRETKAPDELGAFIERTRPEGIVVAAPLSNMPVIVSAIAATNTPFVRMSPGDNDTHEFSVATNDREISAEMTRYLVSLGHRRIAFISGHPQHTAVADRFEGYRDGLRQSGVPFSTCLVKAGDNSVASGETAAAKLLSMDVAPTAIFSANDDMAAGVIRIARERGVDIPGQLSVAGFDDSSLAQQIDPALTTVRQPLSKLAEIATIALIERQADVEPRVGTEVVNAIPKIRQSTGPAVTPSAF